MHHCRVSWESGAEGLRMVQASHVAQLVDEHAANIETATLLPLLAPAQRAPQEFGAVRADSGRPEAGVHQALCTGDP